MMMMNVNEIGNINLTTSTTTSNPLLTHNSTSLLVPPTTPAPNPRRRYGAKIESLPPLETVRPEALKDYTKDELACWLEHYGVTSGYTKPEMKRKLRVVMDKLARGEPPNPHPHPTHTPNVSTSTLSPFNGLTSTPSQPSTFLPFGTTFPTSVDSPSSLASRAGGTSFTFSSLPSIASRVGSSSTISFGTPNNPSTSIPSNVATQATNIVNATHTIHFPKGSITECPHCKRIVSILGPNFWIHLRACDPENFMMYVYKHSRGELAALSIPFEDPLEKGVPQDLITESLEKSQQNVQNRFYQNLDCLNELFSLEPIDNIKPSVEEEIEFQKERFSVIEKAQVALEKLTTDLEKREEAVKLFKQQTNNFWKHYNRLLQSGTSEEIDACVQDYEKDYISKLENNPNDNDIVMQQFDDGNELVIHVL